MLEQTYPSALTAPSSLPPPPPPMAVSRSLLSGVHTTATTAASASLSSTTDTTAAYCSTAQSSSLADAGHGTPGSVLGGVHDISASRSHSSMATAEDAGATSLVSRQRAEAACRKRPRLLRCHAMTPTLLSSGELMAWEQPVLSAAASLPTATPTSVASHPTPNTVPPASFFHTPPPPTPLSPPVSQQQTQQRELRQPRCVRRSGVPFIEQVQQRCRTAMGLTQHLVAPQRLPRASGASAESPLHTAAVVMRQPCGSLSAPLSPISFPCGSHSGSASVLRAHSSAEFLSPGTRQLHWSKRGRVPAAPGVISDANNRRSTSARESGLLDSVRDGQQDESCRSAPGARVGLGEPSELSRDGHDRGMGTGDGALHRVSLSTPLLFVVPSSPSADADAAASSVASTAGTALAHSTTEPAHDTCNLPCSYSRPSGTRYHPQTPRKAHSGIDPCHLAGHPLVSRPPPLFSAAAAQGVLCPPGNGCASAAATASRARDSRPLTFHSHEGGVPSPSPSRWPSTLQAHASLSLSSSAAGAAAAPLMSSAQPGPSPTMSQRQQQRHSPLFAVLPTASVIPSSQSMAGATPAMSAAGGGDSSTPPLVFTAMEPAAADIRSTSGSQYLSQEMQPASRSSSAVSMSPYLAHSDDRGGSPVRAFMLQQHPFSEPMVATSALAASLPPSRTVTPPGIAGNSHDRIAHVDSSATTPRATSDTAVVGSDRPHCAHHPHSHPPEGAVVAAAAVASAAASPSRSSVLQPQQPPPLLPRPAGVHHRPGMPPPLPSLPAMLHACETPSRRQQRPPAERHCATAGAHARQPETAVERTVKAASEMVVPSADPAMLLVVPGGVSSVPAASIAAMIGFSGDAPSWGSDTHADAALALIEDAVEGGSSAEGRLVAPGRRVGGGEGGAGSAETAVEKVITYFPIRKSVLAQRSAYFAALLDEGSGCSPYVRSTPDEYVDLTDLLPLPTTAEPAEARDAHRCRAGGAGVSCPMTAKVLHMSRRPDHLRRGSAAVKASDDAEPARSVATAHRQRVPVYYLPTPETVACFTDDSKGARLGRNGAHSRISAGDPAAVSTPPTLSHACVCQLLHYLYTGVLPIFHQLPGRTGVSEWESTAAAGIASLQSDALRNSFANDYAAVLWMGLYTGLSSLTSSMLKLLWRFLALSRDMWPYWLAAAHWQVPEMQLICEAWIEHHLCAMLRASTVQGLWRGLRLDQVQILVSLRRKALEAEARAAQTSPMASDAYPRYFPGHTTAGGDAAAEASMRSTTTAATMPSFLREQMNGSDAASSVDGSGSVGEEAAEQRRVQLSLSPPAPPVSTIEWPAEVLRYQQPHPLRLRGGSGSGSGSGVGSPSLSSSQPGAGWASSLDNPRVSPATEGVPVLSRDAAASPSHPPLDSLSQFTLPTPPSALATPPALATPLAFDGAPSPGGMAGVASTPLSRQSSRASTPFFASSAAAAARPFRSFSGRSAALGVATTMGTPGIPSSAALTFADLSGVDGAHAHESAGSTAAIAAGARGHRTDLGGGGESGAMMSGAGLTRRTEAPSAANTAFAFRRLVTAGDGAVLRSEVADWPTLAQTNIPARANAEVLRTTPRRSPLTTRGFHDLFDDSRTEPRSPSRLHVAYPPITSASAYYTPSNGMVTQPTLQVLADGAWTIGGCGRLYTAETREELEKRQAYWYRAEWEQQQQLPSAVLLTETEVLERLWTWWRARTEDSSNWPTETEVRAVVEMLQKVRLSDAREALPCTSPRDDAAYDGFRALLDEEQRFLVASKAGLPNATAAAVAAVLSPL